MPPVPALLGRRPEPPCAARARRRRRRHGRGPQGAAPEAGQPGLAGRERQPPDGALGERGRKEGPRFGERTGLGKVGAGEPGVCAEPDRWGAARHRPAAPRCGGSGLCPGGFRAGRGAGLHASRVPSSGGPSARFQPCTLGRRGRPDGPWVPSHPPVFFPQTFPGAAFCSSHFRVCHPCSPASQRNPFPFQETLPLFFPTLSWA